MQKETLYKLKPYITPLNVTFALLLGSFLLPWFGYDLSIQTPCCGIHYLHWFLIPLGALAIYLFAPSRHILLTIAAELCCIANFILLFLSIGYYHEFWNIKGGWDWSGWQAFTYPGFWISAVLFVLLFLIFQYDLWKKRR